MNPATEKKLVDAMSRVHSQVEAEIRKRTRRPSRTGRPSRRQQSANDAVKKVVKAVVPTIGKLLKSAKAVDKDLEKLHDASTDPALVADYYDGREYRERTKKLLDSARGVRSRRRQGRRVPQVDGRRPVPADG